MAESISVHVSSALTVVVVRGAKSVRVLGVRVDVRYRVVGVVVHAAAVVVVRRGSDRGPRLLPLFRRRLARPVLAPAAGVRDPIERHPLHRPVDHGHQVLERGAQLLQITGQHGYGVRGQAAPEPSARAHPVQRQPGTGHVQQQVSVRRRCAVRATGFHKVSQHASPAVAKWPPCALVATLQEKTKNYKITHYLFVSGGAYVRG